MNVFLELFHKRIRVMDKIHLAKLNLPVWMLWARFTVVLLAMKIQLLLSLVTNQFVSVNRPAPPLLLCYYYCFRNLTLFKISMNVYWEPLHQKSQKTQENLVSVLFASTQMAVFIVVEMDIPILILENMEDQTTVKVPWPLIVEFSSFVGWFRFLIGW